MNKWTAIVLIVFIVSIFTFLSVGIVSIQIADVFGKLAAVLAQ